MVNSFSINGICEKCKGYKFAPYNSNMSATVKLCHCPKEDPELNQLKKNVADGLQNMRKRFGQ